jgi:hypothetical protein
MIRSRRDTANREEDYGDRYSDERNRRVPARCNATAVLRETENEREKERGRAEKSALIRALS